MTNKKDMDKATEPCFSNGTEWENWMEHNCEQCAKAISEGLNYKCEIQREIDFEAIGELDYVSVKTFDAAQQTDCPFKVVEGDE